MMDLRELEQSLQPERIVEILNDLGATDYLEKGNYLQFRTICHHEKEEDGNYKLYYYKDSHKFVCYSCCGVFNIYDLFRMRYETLGIEYNFYRDIVLKITNGSEPEMIEDFCNKYESDFEEYNREPTKVELNILPKSLLNAFIKTCIFEWEQEGISRESIEDYNIKFSISQNKIIIPHYDINGNLIGIRGRSLSDEDIAIGKYMPVKVEGKIYSHPLGYNLYGLNISKENIRRLKMAFIFEGEKSCLLYNTYFGKENNISVATCGSSIHTYQIDLLIASGVEKIIIAFDKEGETWTEKEKYYNKLKKICHKYKNKCQMGFIFDFKDRLKLKDSPIDRGKETFLQLYKEAVLV